MLNDSDVRYTPDLPEGDWEAIRDLVHTVVHTVKDDVPYGEAALRNAIAHHVDWAVNVVGFAPVAHDLFRRDVIGAGVAAMPTSRSSSKGRRRSLLFRVGETLGAIPTLPALPTLAAASPSTPYTRDEVTQLIGWADAQRDRDHSSARALLALGLGAGLPTRDLCAVRPIDVAVDGTWLRTPAAKSRLVPVSDEWADDLAELADTAGDVEAPLFRPGVSRTRNLITVFVARSTGATLHPSSQRMRTTWLVRQLAAGLPMQDLLAAAGLASMDALVRYQCFLPPASGVVRAGTVR